MKSITLNENNTQITIDGKEYYLVPNDVPLKLQEPELKTFEDCWNKVKPNFVINSNNSIIDAHTWVHPRLFNYLPTEKSAKQIQAAIKLFVVSQALQGEYNHYDNGKNFNYVVSLTNREELTVAIRHNVYSPFSFKDEETAKKAIDIAKDIFLEYFGIENK